MTLPTDAAERKKLQLYTFMFGYFPDAWLEVVRIARIGNDQHNPGQPLHWARHKSTDQMNAAFNHVFDYGTGLRKDSDGGYHLAKAVWRLMAQLQLDIEAESYKNVKPVDVTQWQVALGKEMEALDQAERVHGQIADTTGWDANDAALQSDSCAALQSDSGTALQGEPRRLDYGALVNRLVDIQKEREYLEQARQLRPAGTLTPSKASERREYHTNGTYWSGVPTVDSPCDFCRRPSTDHDPRTHACPT